MNNWCICWFFTHILLGILIFKGLTVQRLYKLFSVKGLILVAVRTHTRAVVINRHNYMQNMFCYFVSLLADKFTRFYLLGRRQ
jgi:hypothetical protein